MADHHDPAEDMDNLFSKRISRKKSSRHDKENRRNHTRGGSSSMHSLGVRELKQRVRRATSAHPNKRSGDGHHAVSQSRRSKMGSAKKKLRKSRPGSAPARQTPKRV